MKAMLIYKYGSPDVFEWEEIHEPHIKEDELLVTAYGSSVNSVDCAIREGKLKTYATVKQGMKVLINGAGGGVGTFSIQIAKAINFIHQTIEFIFIPKVNCLSCEGRWERA